MREEQDFLSLRVNSCTDLLVPDRPHFVCTAHTQMCTHVKDPISICRKRVGITAVGMENTKTLVGAFNALRKNVF